jgi:hypothetical protein
VHQNAEISPEFLSRLSNINLLQYTVQNSRHETRQAVSELQTQNYDISRYVFTLHITDIMSHVDSTWVHSEEIKLKPHIILMAIRFAVITLKPPDRFPLNSVW